MILTEKKQFDLVVDGVPYSVMAIPFAFNDETRYTIRVNSGEEHIFTWDSELGALRAIDDGAGALPVGVEEAVSRKLQSF
jgi:hypothetical protein